jgi:Chromate transporter
MQLKIVFRPVVLVYGHSYNYSIAFYTSSLIRHQHSNRSEPSLLHLYADYHATQPNFNVAAYCGALAMRRYGLGAALIGAFLAWLGIFLPGLLIKSAVLPLWKRYRGFPAMKVRALHYCPCTASAS